MKSNIKVDKENEYVSYNDELHKYWVKDSSEFCISATTLIHKFTTFDEDFWSSYKAFERVAPESFKKIKNNLLKTKKIQKNIFAGTSDLCKLPQCACECSGSYQAA